MPRRDLITLDDVSNYGLNVFDSVGHKGANNPGDVMVVQAMFRYLYELVKNGHPYFYPDLEELNLRPTGLIDGRTLKAIRGFQSKYWYSSLRVDGLIHPAKYENRKITTGTGKRLMTITLLHVDLWLAEDTGKDYTREIAKRFPTVGFWIR